MEPYEVENNSIVCNIPMEDIKNTIKNESIVVHEIKHEKDENEVSSQVSRISLGGAQVGSLKKKLLVLDINGVLADILFPPPSDIKGEYAMIMRAASIGGDLREYLDGLANSEDMAKYVEEHPFGQEGINEKSDSWYLYLNVIASNLF
ncbi:hypothetical protein TanjilG_32456 [Lupinus angustifolius]|uniref:FCP1 homology domain-containing protein n=1 Tax=Lupinus angustifolius TaxID=3871 RepID=A0A1J7HI80_LUPAN|nr:hypothetical protein TanjilG_32456 [Lupinus angustifolius]